MATYSSFGNIRKRTHSWGVSFFNPRDGEHDKEPHHIYRTFVRKSDAQAWLAAIQVSIQRGEWLSSREEKAAQERAARLAVINEKTFVQYADDWFAVKEHKPSTRTAYMKYYRNHLAPYWGETPLKEITTPLVAVWVKKHLAPNSDGARKKAYELFRAILNDAVLEELIDSTPCNKRTNQLAARKVNGSTRHETRAASAAELMALANTMPDHERLLTLLLGITGLRIGEARELRRHDLDLENGTLMISRGVTGDGKTTAVSTPKTAKRARTVVLAPQLVDLFHDHLEAQGACLANALIFPSSTGADRYINPSTYAAHLVKACETLGVPRIAPHDLRRTTASLATRIDRINAKDVAKTLGHTTRMTMHYVRTDDAEQRRINEHLAADVFGAQPLNITPLRKAQ